MESTAVSPISVDPKSAVDSFAFPLSPAQEEMWNADREHPGNPAYNASFRWKLEGPLDPAILERVFNEIYLRHEVLRATFRENQGRPVQVIAPRIPLRISIVDLRPHLPEERELQMDRECAREARRSFDLGLGPLIRVGLLQMEQTQWILMVTMHHIVTDGWSIGIIMEEIQKIYGAFAENRESPLPDLPIQFVDYVEWQKEWISSGGINPQLEYWKKKLAGYQRLQLPTDFPKKVPLTANSAIVSQLLPRQLTDSLKDLSNREGCTMFITVLAACLMLLQRYTGETDLSVGSPLAGRNRTELESLIGLFINNVIFRTEIRDDPSFPQFLARVRETVWEALANQDVPFQNVVKSLSLVDRTSETPFDVNFICQREYARAATFVYEFAGIRMSTMPSKSQGSLYPLNFFMVEREIGWRLSLDYNADLYSESTAVRLLGHFRELLQGIATNPGLHLSEFSLSGELQLAHTPSASTQSLPSVGQTSSENGPPGGLGNDSDIYKLPASLAQRRFWLLERATPGNPAFHMPACLRLTGAFSHDLLAKSLQVLVERHEILRTSFEEVNGELVQVITASQQFSLPVTSLEQIPQAERETRLAEMIREEARKAFDLILGPLIRVRIFRLAAEEHVLIITTHHIISDGWSQNVIQRELWSIYDALREGHKPSLPAMTIQYADFAHWQKEWLASDGARKELDYWTKKLAGRLPVLDIPTDHPPDKQAVHEGAIGTLLFPEDFTHSLKRLADSENITMFMLMLACFGTLLQRCSGQEDILIGAPFANRKSETESLIGPFSGPICLRLDFSGNPTLRELLQRVQTVVLDALSHTELPFEALVEKLDTRKAYGRSPLFQFYFFYQTAFLQPRQLKDLKVAPLPTMGFGTLSELQFGFVERKEGLRAQLEYNSSLFDASTIEKILSHFRILLDYFLTEPGTRLLELSRPELFGVPLGLQSSSSTDRNIELGTAPVEAELVEPSNDLERELRDMWKEALHSERVGVNQGFFDLGGHSLSAAKLLLNIEKRFGKRLSLTTLFEAPTIRELAGILRDGRSGSYGGRILPIQEGESKPVLFCVDGGPFLLPLARSLGTAQPVYGLRLEDTDQFPSPYRFEDIAAYHIESLRKIQPKGPYFLGGWCLAGVMAYEMARQLELQGEEVPLVALFDAANPAYVRRFSKAEMAVRRTAFWLQKANIHFNRLRRLPTFQFFDYLGGRIDGVQLNLRHAFWRFSYRSRLRKMRRMEGELRGANAVVYLASRDYRPNFYSGRVVLFRSALEPISLHRDPRLGWNELIRDLEVVEIPGDHREIFEEPAVHVLASHLRECLGKSRSKLV